MTTIRTEQPTSTATADFLDRYGVSGLLLGLALWDALLAVVALGLPDLWFQLFHGIPYVDPQGTPADLVGLLRRSGAVWAAFTLFQFIAFLRWRERPYWLAVVAGIRLTEVFSDWTYLFFADHHITWLGGLALLIAPPSNWLMGWFLVRSYHRARDAGDRSELPND